MRLYRSALSHGTLGGKTRPLWMSASGVTSHPRRGRDILLVTGHDEPNAKMVISVPPGIEPGASVDAIDTG
jgi:hypothetical protein